jgi:two-component system phosphate regulon sensor histidine kinase PhoR
VNVRSLRGRMVFTAMAASATALVAVLLLVTPNLRRSSLEQTERTLLAEARLMRRAVAPALAAGASSGELDRLVDAASSEVHARVTLIAPDGRVLADSASSGAALSALDNHLGRPEVQDALRAGIGESRRHSATLDEDLLYAAIALRDGERLTGIVRVALPLTLVRSQAGELQRAVALALLPAFALTAVLAALLSSSLAGPLQRIMQAAREFGAGNTAARIAVAREDELGELARILNQSAAQLEERLAENARERGRTEAILAAMEEGLLAVDHRGTVVVANERLRRSLGIGDPRGRHYVEAVRQSDVGGLVQAVLETGQRQVREVEMPHLRRVWSVTAVPFPGPEGVPHGAVLTFHDVTERRALERVRRDFVANASHELRTPLTSIRGFVEALEDGALSEPDKAGRFLGKIRVHADRMAALVEDLLELSRLESGRQAPNWETVLPGDLAEDTLASFTHAAAGREIALRHHDGQAPAVTSDPERLLRILGNLVDNAIKYTAPGGRVEIESEARPEGGALLRVRDNGPGIAPEHLPRIFERFYRVDAARSRELGGTGLGLSIVKHLAQAFGGSVAVASVEGRGTTISVTLPEA